MKKSKNFVNELLRDLRNTSKYLSEEYIFEMGPERPGMEDDMYGDMEGEYGYDDEEMRGGVDPTIPQQQPQAAQQGDNAEEQAMHAQEVIKHEPIIGKIRETAIEGLKKYSDNPTSKLYEFFKKVFLESDKVLTDTGNKN